MGAGSELQEKPEIVVHDRVELDRLYLTWPTVPHFHDDDAPLILLGDILARGRASRLYRKLVIEEQIAQDVSVYQSGRELAGSFGIVVTLRPSRSIHQAAGPGRCRAGRVESSEVGEDELRRVQKLRIASFYFALEHIGGFGGVADRLNAYNVFRGDPGLIGSDVRTVPGGHRRSVAGGRRAISVRDVRASPSRSSAGRKRPRSHRWTARRRRRVPSRPATGHRCRRSCGCDAASRSGSFHRRDLPTVAGSIVIAGGASLQPPDLPGLSQLTTDMLDEGTTTRTAAQIAMAVEAMGASLSASCGWDGAYVGFRCLADDLGTTLDLAADILINPTFPEAEWHRLHGQTLAALRAERDSAESRAYRALLQALYGRGHLYRFPLAGTEESVRAITVEDLKAFHACSMAPARPRSSSPVTSCRRLWPTSWTGGYPIGGARTCPSRRSPPPHRRHTPGSWCWTAPVLPRRWFVRAIAASIGWTPTFDRMLLFNQVLGGQFTSRLNTKLREERGFTYGVRSSFECRRGAGPFSIGTSVQSDRLAEALEDIRHELTAFVTGRPPTQDELDDARRALVEGQPRHFETPSALVSRYANLLIHGLPADHEAGFANRLLQIDRDSVIHAARTLIHPDALVLVVVADAAQVMESLKRLDWAEPELIEE